MASGPLRRTYGGAAEPQAARARMKVVVDTVENQYQHEGAADFPSCGAITRHWDHRGRYSPKNQNQGTRSLDHSHRAAIRDIVLKGGRVILGTESTIGLEGGVEFVLCSVLLSESIYYRRRSATEKSVPLVCQTYRVGMYQIYADCLRQHLLGNLS